MERLLLVKQAENNRLISKESRDIFIGYMGEEAMKVAFQLVHTLRQEGISAESDHLQRSVKAQMKYANKLGAKYSAIIGESELEEKTLNLKDMASGEQIQVSFDELAKVMKENIGIK
jgi:histidyl-tRNA synthetase